MSESDWLASDDPAAMLAHLRSSYTGVYHGVGDRKLRLWACAWWRCLKPHDRHHERRCAAVEAGQEDYRHMLDQMTGQDGGAWDDDTRRVLTPRGAALLREVVGNPFRRVRLPYRRACPPWCPAGDGTALPAGRCAVCDTPRRCPWLTPDVLALARAAHDERESKCQACKGACRVPAYSGMYRLGSDPCPDCGGTGRVDDGTLDPQRLAVLSDALEEAGCDDRAVLDHCRGPGPHVRGCWAVDLVLGLG